MRYDRTLKEVISDILAGNDVLLEEKEGGCLEVVLPEETAKTLEMPEYARLYFTPSFEDKNGIYVSYETDFFSRLDGLVMGKGRCSVARYPFSDFNEEKIVRLLPEKISFNNAIFRPEKKGLEEISYFLFFFKYIAVSDEKREGVISCMVNGLTRGTNFMTDYFPDDLEEVLNYKDLEIQDCREFIEPAYKATLTIARMKLDELVNSLERRLNRDIDRIYQYYETLKDEVRATIKKKGTEGQEIGKLYGKLDVIESEKKWKCQDMAAKYSLDIKLEPLVVVQIVTETLVFRINIKRRLSARLFPVSYNPILKKIDSLPCESCFAPEPPYYVCDEKHHIVCRKCFNQCSVCGKQFCRACYDKCPKCKENSGA